MFKRSHGKVNLCERLGYLDLVYKDERNRIIHGIEENFIQDWKLVELLSACLDILNVFQELLELKETE